MSRGDLLLERRRLLDEERRLDRDPDHDRVVLRHEDLRLDDRDEDLRFDLYLDLDLVRRADVRLLEVVEAASPDRRR